MYPAGAAVSTIADLATFMTALMNPAAPLFHRPATQAAMESTSYWLAQNTRTPIPANAHGFWELPSTVRTIGHGGNTLGFSANLQFAPSKGFGVVVLTNQQGEGQFTGALVRDLFGVPAVPKTNTKGFPDAHKFAGSYIGARRTYTGSSAGCNFPDAVSVVAKDNNTLAVPEMGLEFTQVRPYVFQSKVDGSSFYVEVRGGKVVRVAGALGPSGDALPISQAPGCKA
jgi:hypothetical protein